VRGLSGFSKSYAEGVLTFKDGEFLEDRRDVLPDLRAKKMAGISRSFFLFQNVTLITSLTGMSHRRTRIGSSIYVGRRVEKDPQRIPILCTTPTNAAGKAMLTH
jgi:hypothetical protein